MGEKRFFQFFIISVLTSVSCSVMQPGIVKKTGHAGLVSVPKIFGDHMVLQRNQPIPVWGTSEPGGEVIVRLGYQRVLTHADTNGQWSAELPAMKAGGPHELVIMGRNILRFTDVYIGEVWLCSGQSNMEFTLAQINQAEDEMNAANYPGIRLLTVDKNIAFQPLNNFSTDGWKICSPKTAPDFSAVGYFFGRMLHQKLGVPVGLIHSSWGGTMAEAWMSEPALGAFPEFAETLQIQKENIASMPSYEEQQGLYESVLENFKSALDSLDQGLSDTGLGWAAPGLFADDWSVAKLPGLWEQTEIGAYDGVIWYRRAVNVPESIAGGEWTLSLGPIDDIDQTWVNGIQVGSMDIYNELREYTIPPNVIQPGMNVIVVRVTDHHGGGGIWGTPDQLKLATAADSIPLSGDWLYKIGIPPENLPPIPEAVTGLQNSPAGLYNAMIAPLVPYGIQGVIWYQGESNADRAFQYRSLFKALIQDWRKQWDREIGFYFVQLANYMAVQPEPGPSQWAELREAQTMALDLPHTGMAVIIDIGEANDIHPKNKQDVGKRLALSALAGTYKQDVVPSGPLYQKMTVENGKIRIGFEYTAGGLQVMGADRLLGFAIADESREFQWADAQIDGETVIVSSPEVANPVAVRYAWADNPICNLYNRVGLPASPFRTDDWSR